MALLTAQDRQRIETSISAAERMTAAEIVVACIAHGDSYLDLRVLAAGLIALAGGAGLSLGLPWLDLHELLALQTLIAVAVFAVSGLAPVLRACVPGARKHSAVERAAQLAFLKHSVFATRERTGVLILLSELEHKVVILGDQGIHARVQDPGWQKHVESIVRAIGAGRAADGVCEVIDSLAKVLAEGAPIRADDTNELPNRVRDD